ncbi:hypothetical protein [Mesorhizobium sp.]|uniref:hypothetical protein n=1 Tax=Mesorhizobium sp. TaxID=1871066 RepID=UPI0025FAFAA1|nr:hypothetical protein [Mesorhizobium sp.]
MHVAQKCAAVLGERHASKQRLEARRLNPSQRDALLRPRPKRVAAGAERPSPQSRAESSWKKTHGGANKVRKNENGPHEAGRFETWLRGQDLNL